MRILVVKLAALGDVIMASTMIAGIRTEWPTAEITWVVGAAAAPIVRLMHGIDRVIEVDDRALLSGHRAEAGIAMFKAWRAIGRGYDVALVAHTDARYELLARVSGAKVVRRFAKETGPREGRWHGAEYLRLIRDEMANDAFAQFPALKAAVVPPLHDSIGVTPFVVVAPGGGRNVLRDDALRRWPQASWAAVTEMLVSRGHHVVCVGGANDAAEGAACSAAGATDLTGRTTLLELFAVLKSATVVATHDAGPLHLALLAERPVVALFGPTRSEERIPGWARAIALNSVDDLPCAPCYDGHNYAPCARNLCLTRVTPMRVVTAIELQVASHPCANSTRDSQKP